jgi:hypothetical protein
MQKPRNITREMESNNSIIVPPSRKSLATCNICHECHSYYEIPGLDANYCPQCGWVEDPIWNLTRIKASALTQRKQPELNILSGTIFDQGEVAG